MTWSDARPALLGAWLVVSLAVALVLLAPLVLADAELDQLVPVCQWKARYNRECPLCGMTTAFRLISRGRLSGATRSHRHAIPLYSAMLLNEIVAVIWLVRRRSIILGLAARRR